MALVPFSSRVQRLIILYVLLLFFASTLSYFLIFLTFQSVRNVAELDIATPIMDRGVVFTKSQLDSVIDKLAVRSQSDPYLPVWNVHLSNNNGQWNFNSLWNLARRPDPSYILTQLYHVHHGRLYGWKPHQKGLRQHLYYNMRVRRYEQLLARSLSLARDACDQDVEQQRVDPRVHELIRDPFPFAFYWMDFITCREHPWFKNTDTA
mmetsp:Transcript_18738/g.26568  ORF Transcript_18738/g.26568 Transcript_18738/m.26568 type:complete len:207 (+) Transcript_18738:81-701(+)